MKLFETLQRKKLIDDYIPFLDWIFEDKFPSDIWDNKNKVQAYAKKIMKLDGLSKDKNFFNDAQKRLDFPSKGDYKNNIPPVVYMSRGDGIARGWIRHIRNGIAHSNNQVVEKGGKLFIELLDFSDDAHVNQTAYIFVPLEYLLESMKIYNEKTKAYRKNKAKIGK